MKLEDCHCKTEKSPYLRKTRVTWRERIPMEHTDPVLVAFNGMINELSPTRAASIAIVRVFEGAPTALLGISVAFGGVFAAFIVYWLIVWLALGKQAWDVQHIPKGWTLRDEVFRDKYQHDQIAVQKYAPQLFEVRRPRWSGIAHAVAIILCVSIVILGVYVAFQVCGIPPSILVGLGVVGLGISWGLQGLVMEIVAAIQIHLGNEAREGDNIWYWAGNKYGKIKYMGATRVVFEEVNENGDMLVHHLTYRQLLGSGFTRFESGGERFVYRYDPDKAAQVKNAMKGKSEDDTSSVGYNLLAEPVALKKRR